jgi:hypothetical protein
MANNGQFPPAPVKSGQLPTTPQDALDQARYQLFLLMTGQATQRIATPQLGDVQYHPTSTADLQRLIDYLEYLVGAGNTWPTVPGGGGSMTTGFTTGRKPFSFYGWP